MTLRPFMPWMGSKRLLAKQLVAKVPPAYGRYIEPFLGSGALLYALQPAEAYASDELGAVVDLHRAVANDAAGTAAAYLELATGCDREDTFLRIRERYPAVTPSEFLFLLKHCHGSRFRVNKAGKFNSPFNRSSLKASTPSEQGLAADTRAMVAAGAYGRSVDFARADFSERLGLARPGDLLFLDPPYQWQDKGEADYGGQWGAAGFKRLADALRALPPGVHIMMTLHGSMQLAEVEALLEGIPGMRVEAVALNGSHLRRGGMEPRREWLARNYVD